MVKKGERKTIEEPFMCYINELLCEFAVQVFDISRECGATAVKVQVSICCTLNYQVPRRDTRKSTYMSGLVGFRTFGIKPVD